jgi:FkbM family methyltransferase
MKFQEKIEKRGGASFYVSDSSDLYVLREMYEMGDGLSVYKIRIEQGMKVLDIGAHKGIFAVWSAQQGAEVWAYEPHPEIFQTLNRNVKLNSADVHTFPFGVWDTNDEVVFRVDPDTSILTSCCKIEAGMTESIQVPVKAIDEVIGDREWDILKMDIEGAEYKTLLASKKLSQVKYLALEWHASPNQEDARKLETKLKQFFDINDFDPNWMIVSGKRR